MKRIQDFGLFLEAKETENNEIKKEVKKIISEMFSVGKNIKFSGEHGDIEDVEFEVDFNDYKLSYDKELVMEYTEGVLKKRKYQVSLKFGSKSKEGVIEKPIYKLKFKIKLKSTAGIKFGKKETILGWLFEEKPIKTIKFIEKGKQACDWSDSDGRLTIAKSAFDKLASDQLRAIIRGEGGEKVRIN
jgi:hypothetical protein